MRGVPQGRDRRARSTRRWRSCASQGQEDKLPGQLSGGQQQRVAIARAIVIEPPLVLMDEPLSNLDAKLRLEMRAEIRRIHNELGATTIYVTHDQDEALSLADRIVVLRDGVVRQVGTPEELYRAPGASRRRRVHGLPQPADRARSSPASDGRAVLDVGGARDQRHRPRAASRSATRLRRHPAGRSRRRRAGRTPSRRRSRPSSIAAANSSARRARPTALDFVFRSDQPVEPGESVRLRRRASAFWSSRSGQRERTIADRSGRRSEHGRQPAPAPRRPRARRRHAARRCRPSLFSLLLFVYPFVYGLVLSFEPKAGGDWLANYERFFSDPFLYDTIANDALARAAGRRSLNLLLAVPIALRVRLMRRQRLLTTILVLPITLGTVLVAEGLLNYLGPQGWFNRTLMTFGLISQPGEARPQLLGRVRCRC